MTKSEIALQLFTQGFEKILDGLDQLGYTTTADENFADTPERAAKALAELVVSREDSRAEIAQMLGKSFPARYREMVISKHSIAFGICPHHLLPVIYRISLAYIPTEKVLGISKLSRMAKLLARAPMLQEELTHELAQILHMELSSEGSGVYVEGLHLCLASRGTRAHETRLVTSAVRGVFLDQLSTRQEFMKLVTMSHPPLV